MWERDHDHFPHAVLDRAPEHRVLGIAGGRLGDPEIPDLAFCLLL
jgi:hypothetical protein